MLSSLLLEGEHSIDLLLCLGCSVVLGTITYIVARNVLFHPLRSFPGPFWARFTDVYHTYLLSTRMAHQKELELHRKYGKI